jgi:hypothetical protein
MSPRVRQAVARCFIAISNALAPFAPPGWPDSRRPHSHLYNTALQIWLIFLIAMSVKVACWPYDHSSYLNYEFGAQRWWAELSMYDVEAEGIDYRYGPVFAVLLSPLAVLPTQWGGVLFTWINTGLFFASLRAAMRHLLPGDWTPKRQAVFLILVFATTLRMLWAAQINPTVFALVVGGAVALKQQRWWTASVLLSLAVHFKVWPIAVAAFLIGCWPRPLSWRFALSVTGWALVPFLTKPASVVCMQYHEWYNALVGRILLERHFYRDAWAVWELIQASVPRNAYIAAQFATAFLVLALCLWQRKKAPTISHQLTFVLAMWAAWQLVFGPATERNTFGLIGPLTSWAMLTAWTQKRGVRLMLASMVCTILLANGSVERALEGTFPMIAVAHPLGVALFAIWLVGFSRDWGQRACDARFAPHPIPSPHFERRPLYSTLGVNMLRDSKRG